MSYILSIDQGTTSSRAILFDSDGRPRFTAQQEFQQIFPRSGWVEHNPEEIWTTTLATSREVVADAGAQGIALDKIAAIGITNQRETTVIWDRHTGKPIANAIVWQDRRTADTCAALRRDGSEPEVTSKTGLLLDPYFSATKIAWLLDNVDGARVKAERGELCFGTIDTFLLWRLTGGSVHATDATNASRTMLYNIKSGEWDDDLLRLFNVPRAILPSVENCAHHFGDTGTEIIGRPIAIRGIAGDQQAAALGQACFEPGMMKSTYGTGCFALLNTGSEFVPSTNRLLTTIAAQLEGEVTYALEGSIFIAGAAVQWLRDGLSIVDSASQTQAMAEAASDDELILVPSFAGLGAPYWRADARGAMFGISRGTDREAFARATLEAVCFQTRDLLEAMRRDWDKGGRSEQAATLRVDGGLAANDWAMQFLADITAAQVDRPKHVETTALGAAWLAGMHAGVWPGQKEFANQWHRDRWFEPAMENAQRDRRYARWQRAVESVLYFHDHDAS